MKTYTPLKLILVLLFSSLIHFCVAQQKNAATKAEIEKALQLWNSNAKQADVKRVMGQFDNSENIMVVGSDSGEIYKEPKQIEEWLGGLFSKFSFEWEMKRVDIDFSENTAWVFIDGAMIVTSKEGQSNKTPYRFSGILVKKNAEWKWRLYHGSIPKAE